MTITEPATIILSLLTVGLHGVYVITAIIEVLAVAVFVLMAMVMSVAFPISSREW